jgi:hypothetical protein
MYEEMTGIKAKQIVVMIAVDQHEPQVFVRNRKDYIPELARKVRQFRDEKAI